MILGVHPSVRRGVPAAIAAAAGKGCRALQIFPRRPGTALRMPDEEEARAVRQARAERGIVCLAVHSVYQPNIASSDPRVLQRSLDSFRGELDFAHRIGAEFLVIHSGSFSPGSDLRSGLERCAQSARRALLAVPSATRVLIENVAGGGRRMGGRFEELKALLDGIAMPERTGICLDTAHAFGQGYRIDSAGGMDDCLAEFDRVLGLDNLRLFHVNDSRAELGSHKDLHEHVGRGRIGAGPLRHLARLQRFRDVAGILETPQDAEGSDAENLEALAE